MMAVLAVSCAGSIEVCQAAGIAPKASAAGAIPRLSDGHPDLNGTWDNGSGIDFIHPEKSSDGSVCISGCEPAVGAAPAATAAGAAPATGAAAAAPVAAAAPAARKARPAPNMPRYKPQFLAKVRDLDKRQVETDPVLRCRSPGLPRIGPPDKIVQRPGQVVFLYDDVSGAFFRIIPTDGRAHRTDVDDSYLGDSVGHWEGDTLVIEANQFNDDSWLTDNGAFHTRGLTVTERLHRSGDEIEYQAVANDPAVLVQPWKPDRRILKLTQVELAEPVPCVDQDLKHLVDESHHANPR